MGKAENPVSEVIGQFSKIMERLLPVGSIIEWAPVEGGANVDLTTPQSVSNYYGFGTWEAYGSGQMLLGVSDGHAIGSTGGEAEHTLTVQEIPSHAHTMNGWTIGTEDKGASTGLTVNAYPLTYNNSNQTTRATGGDSPTTTCPPYRATYIWRRTA